MVLTGPVWDACSFMTQEIPAQGWRNMSIGCVWVTFSIPGTRMWGQVRPKYVDWMWRGWFFKSKPKGCYQKMGGEEAGTAMTAPHFCGGPCISSKVKVLVAQSCLTPCDSLDCSPPGSLCPWDSPGKNIEMGCSAFLQGTFSTQGGNPGLLHCRWIKVCWDITSEEEAGGKCRYIARTLRFSTTRLGCLWCTITEDLLWNHINRRQEPLKNFRWQARNALQKQIFGRRGGGWMVREVGSEVQRRNGLRLSRKEFPHGPGSVGDGEEGCNGTVWSLVWLQQAWLTWCDLGVHRWKGNCKTLFSCADRLEVLPYLEKGGNGLCFEKHRHLVVLLCNDNYFLCYYGMMCSFRAQWLITYLVAVCQALWLIRELRWEQGLCIHGADVLV